MPDHVHLLIQPLGIFNVSEIMHNLKRTTSLHINETIEHAFREGKFQWQKSYHDHAIRDHPDSYNHIQYIKRQREKHGAPKELFASSRDEGAVSKQTLGRPFYFVDR